jgi:hypothetical protein
MNIFEFNEDSPIIIEEFMGSKIYYIDNFFKNPDIIVNFLDEIPPVLHEPVIREGFKNLNGVYFSDMRHSLYLKKYSPVVKYLSKICGKKPFYDTEYNLLETNYVKFNNTPFNNYKNNYWFPHVDGGYNGIIYLNKGDEQNGTNIYEPTADFYKIKECNNGEHTDPWKSKDRWLRLKTIKPKYNRCVLFDGARFFHGMNIENERYFENEFRKNIITFFKV